MLNRIRVHSPSRLHFGLLGWGDHAPRQFGGVGLMIEEPGLEILVEPTSRWEAIGPSAARTLEVAMDVAKRLGVEGFPVGPIRLENLALPEAHVGLGVGTQLSLAVARALTELAGLHHTPVTTLARLTNRGRRSGIGIHGFAEGGFIVDAGRRGDDDLPTKLIRLPFPGAWSILIVLPEQSQGLHGVEELNAFGRLPPMLDRMSDRLCRLVLLGLLPALYETDLYAFGAALSEIQQIVGRTFSPVQGGHFSHPEIELVGESMTRLGLQGVGQSSWGPTLYGFSDGDEKEREKYRQRLIHEFKFDPRKVYWTRASNVGAITTPT